MRKSKELPLKSLAQQDLKGTFLFLQRHRKKKNNNKVDRMVAKFDQRRETLQKEIKSICQEG